MTFLRRKKTRPTDRLKFYQVTGRTGRHEKIDSMEWLDIYFGNVRVQRLNPNNYR